METDGFQADTEEDAEDDCVIVTPQSGESQPLCSQSHRVDLQTS